MSAGKYRKRPVVIEAFQMTRERMHDKSEWPDWLHAAWDKSIDEPGSFFLSAKHRTGPTLFSISTLEGFHDGKPGDFIIKGVKGELYPCKPDIFALTYEPVEDES